MAAPLAPVHHRRELRLLQLVGLAVRAPAGRLHDLEPGARGAHLAERLDVAAPGAALAGARREPRRARLLQVLRLLRHLDGQHGVVGRPRRAPRREVDRAAGRHLLLHVHGDQLRRRRVPRRVRADDAREVRGVPLVLPAPRGRADRAPGRVDPPDRQAPRPAPRRHEPRLLPDRDGIVQEGGDRELPRGVDRRRGVRSTGTALVARDPHRDLCLRGPDLRRLLRLHRHGDRDRPAARLLVPAELRLAVCRRFGAGLLATLAHDALALAPRLRLHPARRQPEGDDRHLPERDADDADRRALARRSLDLRRLGRPPRHRARRRAVVARPPRRRRAPADDPESLDRADPDLPLRLLRVDLLPLGLVRLRLGDDRGPLHRVGRGVAARHRAASCSRSQSASARSTCRRASRAS